MAVEYQRLQNPDACGSGELQHKLPLQNFGIRVLTGI